MRTALAVRHYSPKTAEAYVTWVRRFVVFHGRQHPLSMGGAEVSAFLSHLAVERNVSASTQNQALAALLYLYAEVLRQPLEPLGNLVRAKRPARIPVVMSRAEVKAVLNELDGVWYLMASLLYGSGLRLLECVSLRVKDIDFGNGQVLVRRGKGHKDRSTLLPHALVEALRDHLVRVRERYDGRVQPRPSALRRSPNVMGPRKKDIAHLGFNNVVFGVACTSLTTNHRCPSRRI
jgi:integrase